ncbi:hypothetical protein [Desulfocurvibacter africanus]|uniref:Uncharacterized protein n=1 Tax=Desulfocurvibacter africanus subsp. africanus str. Walvis Bay TaxID=690850 RepID=F3YXK2_DESAF|nr:hypothetical protein [Desulfocurvibacter africanus]EGJ51779.1 hypothetical protein Desaf_3495 [Desulfocurvibacter africanus subsp. africanus str. Walvis Bay]
MTLTLTSPWALLAAVLAILIILAVAGAGLFAGWTMGRKSLLPVLPEAPRSRRKAEPGDKAWPAHDDPWSAAQDRGEPAYQDRDPDQGPDRDPDHDPDRREETL